MLHLPLPLQRQACGLVVLQSTLMLQNARVCHVPLALFTLFLLFIAAPAFSEVTADNVDVPVVGAKCNDRVKEVSSVGGLLRVPVKAKEPVTAMVMLHSNAGIIGVGDFYARALNAAGIATLEIDSFTPRGVRSGSERNAPVLCDRLQDAWGALVYLAKDARINPQQIGIAGFSSGLTWLGVESLSDDIHRFLFWRSNCLKQQIHSDCSSWDVLGT